MATIRDLISNRTIHYVQPNQTVFEAASYMVDCNVGAVPVLDDTKLVGIFSERDIMRRVVTEGRNPLTTRIADVMSTDLRTVTPGASSEEAMCVMQSNGVRHLPVCEGTHAGRISLAARSAALSSGREVGRGGHDARLHPDLDLASGCPSSEWRRGAACCCRRRARTAVYTGCCSAMSLSGVIDDLRKIAGT